MHTLVKQIHRNIADRLGIGASLLCLIHCMLTPVVCLLFPALSSTKTTWSSHLFIALFVFSFAGYALYRGYAHHHSLKPIVLGCLGLFFISLALFLTGAHKEIHFLDTHIVLTMLGSLFLVTAHIINVRSCSCCSNQNF